MVPRSKQWWRSIRRSLLGQLIANRQRFAAWLVLAVAGACRSESPEAKDIGTITLAEGVHYPAHLSAKSSQLLIADMQDLSVVDLDTRNFRRLRAHVEVSQAIATGSDLIYEAIDQTDSSRRKLLSIRGDSSFELLDIVQAPQSESIVAQLLGTWQNDLLMVVRSPDEGQLSLYSLPTDRSYPTPTPLLDLADCTGDVGLMNARILCGTGTGAIKVSDLASGTEILVPMPLDPTVLAVAAGRAAILAKSNAALEWRLYGLDETWSLQTLVHAENSPPPVVLAATDCGVIGYNTAQLTLYPWSGAEPRQLLESADLLGIIATDPTHVYFADKSHVYQLSVCDE